MNRYVFTVSFELGGEGDDEEEAYDNAIECFKDDIKNIYSSSYPYDECFCTEYGEEED